MSTAAAAPSDEIAIGLALGNVLWQYRSAKRERGIA